MRILDPLAGGAPLLVLYVGCSVDALATFIDLATGRLRLATGSSDGSVRVYDLVKPVPSDRLRTGDEVTFECSGSSRNRRRNNYRRGKILRANGDTYDILQDHDSSDSSNSRDEGTGKTETKVSRQRIRVTRRISPPLYAFKGHKQPVTTLTAFADSATGEMRLASGSNDKTFRVWSLNGDASPRMVALDAPVTSAAIIREATRVAFAWATENTGGSCGSRAPRIH